MLEIVSARSSDQAPPSFPVLGSPKDNCLPQSSVKGPHLKRLTKHCAFFLKVEVGRHWMSGYVPDPWTPKISLLWWALAPSYVLSPSLWCVYVFLWPLMFSYFHPIWLAWCHQYSGLTCCSEECPNVWQDVFSCVFFHSIIFKLVKWVRNY